MAKTNPIGVRFDTELLNHLKEMDADTSPQRALTIYEECFMREFSLFGKKPNKPIHIYKLINPISKEIFYIGRTTFFLHQRLSNHVGQRRSKCQGVNQKKNEVINTIIEAGYTPIIELIETVHPSDDSEYNGHHEREIYWIAQSVLDRQPLVNKIPERSKELIRNIEYNNQPENKKRILVERNATQKPIEPQFQNLNEFTNQVPNLSKEPPKTNYVINNIPPMPKREDFEDNWAYLEAKNQWKQKYSQ